MTRSTAKGKIPAPRRGFAVASIGSHLFMWGGIGPTREFDELYVLDAGTFPCMRKLLVISHLNSDNNMIP